MEKITKDMLIAEVLRADDTLAEVFFEFGMHCLGCPIANNESIEQAAEAHGIDLTAMLDALNIRSSK